MKFNLLTSFFCLILVLIVIISQAKHQFWYPHLNMDIINYYSKVEYLYQHKSLAGIPYNEYQPGAIVLFLFTSLLSNSSVESFGNIFLWITVLFIFLVTCLYFASSSAENIVVFAAVLLFTGPIVFFRFEIFVGLLVVLSIYLFIRHKFNLSLIFLGFATLTKIYPIVLLPLLLFLTYQKRGLKAILFSFLSYSGAILVPLFIYMSIFQVSFDDLLAGITFHTYKPISLETIWASLITLVVKIIGGQHVELAGGWGVWGISPDIIGSNAFYNNFWLLPIGIIYAITFLKLKKISSEIILKISILLILALILFSKVLQPQYILWFIVLIPMLNFQRSAHKTLWTINLILILLIVYLTQYIYPLRYTDLLDFYRGAGDINVFWINLIKNILLFILFVNICIDVIKTSKNQEQNLQDPYAKS